MTVEIWILESWIAYESSYIEGVFSSRENAIDYMKEKHPSDYSESMTIYPDKSVTWRAKSGFDGYSLFIRQLDRPEIP